MKKEQTLWDEIQSLPNDKQYNHIPNFPIPLGKSVLIKRCKKEIIEMGGIIIPDTTSENTQTPKYGIIMAVGPLCTKGVRVGLRCNYNFYADLEVRIGVETYVMMDENDIYFILRDNQTVSQGSGIKPAKQVRRAKSIAKQDDYVARKHKSDMNEKDKKQDKTKGKTFAIHFKPKGN